MDISIATEVDVNDPWPVTLTLLDAGRGEACSPSCQSPSSASSIFGLYRAVESFNNAFAFARPRLGLRVDMKEESIHI